MMSVKLFALSSIAAAVRDAAASAIPTVDLPLGYNFKITTDLTLPWSNTSIELVFDSGSENFWVFGPNAISNYGCTGLFCLGPCNVTVTPFYDWPNSPTHSEPEPFSSFYAYGGYTKYITGSISVNDTFTFASTGAPPSTIENVRVAVSSFMSSRIGMSQDSTCDPNYSGYDLGILGIAPFQRSQYWNTSGPHVRQELLDRGVIKAPVQSMWFDQPPAEWDGAFTGRAVFGGIDKSKFAGPLVKVPVKSAGDVSVGYYVAVPTISVDGVALPQGELETEACQLDSGTTVDDLPVVHEAFMAALGLVEFNTWPGPCDTIPLNKTFDITFPAIEGQGVDNVTITVPLRHYARPGSQNSATGTCALRLTSGGCMLAAGFSAAAYFAADDAANEIALAQGGVTVKGSLPDPASMSLTI